MARNVDGSSDLCFCTYVLSTHLSESMNRLSSVGVIELITIIRKKGTCNTDFEMKFNPWMSWSSHVSWSRLTKTEIIQMSSLTR